MIKFYEDFSIGEESELGEHTFTREGIIAFARAFDPQPFHLDEPAAEASIFRGITASGWHTAGVAMRKIIDWRDARRAELAARGEPLPPLGVSPGARNIRWPLPVRPGDTLTFRSRVEWKRETRRPQWGLVGMRTWGVNQNGHEAYSFEGMVFAARRGA
jgi:acyl dehydratase